MKPTQDEHRLSLELPDGEAAMRLAQEIADACGGTVTVVDAAGDNVGHAMPGPGGAQNGLATIASIQKLADAMDVEMRRTRTKGEGGR